MPLPNQKSPEQQQRIFLFLAFMLAALFVMNQVNTYFMPPPEPVAQATPAPGTEAVMRKGSSAQGAAVAQQETTEPTPVAPQGSMPIPPEQAAQGEHQLSISSDLFTAVIDNRGAVLTSMLLHEYERKLRSGDSVNMLSREPDPAKPGYMGLAFSGDPERTMELASARFVPANKATSVDLGDEPQSFIYTYTSPQGIRYERAFSFSPDQYVIEVTYGFANQTQGPMILRGASAVAGNTFGLSRHALFDANISNSNTFAHYGPFIATEGSFDTEKFGDSPLERLPMSGAITWAALDTPYFIGAIGGVENPSNITVDFVKDNDRAYAHWPLGDVDLLPGQSRSFTVKTYLGPKELSRLTERSRSLAKSVSLGWFRFIGAPLLQALDWFYGFVLNYGVAIILLTLVVRTLMLALTYRSMISMQKMATLSPKIEALKKKFPDTKDRDKLNMAMMELYKEEGVNPISGCLPMLLQIPIFIALYNVLYSAIELRHAPFALWIVDLSSPDPFKALPILMGVTMFVQQSFMVTPGGSGPQATQMKMMKYMMPPFLVAISWNFPAGLVLYWTTSNIFGALQQWAFKALGLIPTPPAQPSGDGEQKSGSKKKKRRKK